MEDTVNTNISFHEYHPVNLSAYAHAGSLDGKFEKRQRQVSLASTPPNSSPDENFAEEEKTLRGTDLDLVTRNASYFCNTTAAITCCKVR